MSLEICLLAELLQFESSFEDQISKIRLTVGLKTGLVPNGTICLECKKDETAQKIEVA